LVEEAQRLHFPASPVSTPLDLVNDPQLLARGFLTKLDHREFGTINFPQGAVASLSGDRLSPAPKLGEHNSEILSRLQRSPGNREIRDATGGR